MTDSDCARKNVADVEASIERFAQMFVPELREHFELSAPYRMYDCGDGQVNWPNKYRDVWGKEPTNGVYVIFDRQGYVVYVGKSVSIGSRLSAYFVYARGPYAEGAVVNANGCCTIDAAIKEYDGAVVRAVILSEVADYRVPFHCLSEALESYLIATLSPPANKRGRVS